MNTTERPFDEWPQRTLAHVARARARQRYPLQTWTVIAVPENDGGTTVLTRPYAKRNIIAGHALDAISKATEPSAEQVRRLIAELGLDETSYDRVRTTLVAVLREDTP